MNVVFSFVNPDMTGSSPIPGVDDMMGEYRLGDALIVIAARSAGMDSTFVAGTTAHFPFTHPQLPAPQSSGPSQFAVHVMVQTRETSGIQPDG